jgi:hypothetical protein
MKHHSKHQPIIKLKARAWINGIPVDFYLSGQTARTLAALVDAKSKGVTALEMSSWAYRLGAYIHTLRREYGLKITMRKEKHPGGWHGRYMLETRLEIQSVKYGNGV